MQLCCLTCLACLNNHKSWDWLGARHWARMIHRPPLHALHLMGCLPKPLLGLSSGGAHHPDQMDMILVRQGRGQASINVPISVTRASFLAPPGIHMWLTCRSGSCLSSLVITLGIRLGEWMQRKEVPRSSAWHLIVVTDRRAIHLNRVFLHSTAAHS